MRSNRTGWLLLIILGLAASAQALPPQTLQPQGEGVEPDTQSMVRDLGVKTRDVLISPVDRGELERFLQGVITKPKLRELDWYYRRHYPFDWTAEPQWRERTLGLIQTRMVGPRDAGARRWSELSGDDFPGSLTGLAIHPQRPETLYAATRGGGVWKTDDGGRQWRPLTDTSCTLALSSIAIDPHRPETVYAGTGDPLGFGQSELRGCGLLRSEDGGATWSSLPAPAARIRSIWLPPEQDGTLFLATDAGILLSRDRGGSFQALGGGLPEPKYWANQVIGHPARPGRLYAAYAFLGFYRSDDGGASWRQLTGLPASGLFGAALALAPSQPERVYASLGAYKGGNLVGLYTSDDAGDSWRRLEAPDWCASQCWYAHVLAVDPGSPDTLYLGGLDLYRTTDGGGRFEKLTDWRLIVKEGGTEHPQYVHGDQHVIIVPRPGTVWVGSDGGVSLSTDAGKKWVQRSKGMRNLQYYSLAIDPQDPRSILAGAQDNGTHAQEDGGRWFMVWSGDGGVTTFSTKPYSVYFSSQNLNIVRWRQNEGTIELPTPWEAEQRAFIAPYIIHPADGGTLLAGAQRLWRSPDGGDTWAPASAVLSHEQGFITAIAGAPTNLDVIYVAALGPGVVGTSDGGRTWSSMNAGLPRRYPTSLDVHPQQPGTVLAAFQGLGTGHVFRSTDGGRSWMDLSVGLPDVGVNVVRHDPQRPDQLWIGTDLGLFSYDVASGAWQKAPEGLPNVPVYDLAFAPDGAVRIATFGRGLWQLAPAGVSTAAATSSGALQGYFQPQASAPGGLQLEVSMDREGAEPVYRVGDALHVRLQCSADCFVTLAHVASDGSFGLLLPPMRLAAGKPFEFPGPGRTVRVQPPAGRELLIAVASAAEPPRSALGSAEALRALGPAAARVERSYRIAE
jgi:photosystem II stability/assembly factor-like uncharacterized protein